MNVVPALFKHSYSITKKLSVTPVYLVIFVTIQNRLRWLYTFMQN